MIETQATQAELRERAAGAFPGGVNSPVRAFRAVGRDPVILARGSGSRVVDADGRELIDLIGAWGAAILGHAHPAVVDAVRAAAQDGFALGATHPSEVELADAIRKAMPSVERLRFTSSGTEAAMTAVRVARAATGRDLIVKFAGAYHGHSDGLLVDAGSGLATLAIPGSAGVPARVARQTIVLDFNDAAAVDRAFRRYLRRIAAVIVEPAIANAGVIAPATGFLDHLRAVTGADGAILIFDEVITGFRLARGGAQARFGVRPDLTVLGKVIGGGMPIGAYGGRADLMALVAPEGRVYQAGTLAGHPLTMAAGIATLRQLGSVDYEALEARVAALAGSIERDAVADGQPVAVSRCGPLLTVFFGIESPRDARQALQADRAAYARFFGAMLDDGILLPPSPFEAWFPGFAHTDDDLARVASAAGRALRA